MSRKEQEYFIGLDMGTSSVGWAVTDPQYKLLKFRGRDMWGMREFDEANGADSRRSYRIARRRHKRELFRLNFLKDQFREEIEKVDPNFFIRLENSKYHKEDKASVLKGSMNAIFDDKDFKDQDYFEKYPTIFHLRRALINDEVPYDEKYSRLVFLALHNMYKRRGNFLNTSLSDKGGEVSRPIAEIYKDLQMNCNELFGTAFPENVDADELQDILQDNSISKTAKKEKITELLGLNKKQKKEENIILLICGLAAKLKNFDENIEDSLKKETMKFSEEISDEKEENWMKTLGEEKYSCLMTTVKELYDSAVLNEILNGKDYISEARVESYDKHKKDLKLLKAAYRLYADEKTYEEMFRSNTGGTYSAYVNGYGVKGKSKKDRRNYEKKRSREELYKRIKKDLNLEKRLKEDSSNEILTRISNEIDIEAFLPKQLTAENGVIPNQIYVREMRKILSNAEKYLDFLKQEDTSIESEEFKTVSDKIIAMFKFHIPYYVGPTTEKSKEFGGNGWVTRKAEGKIYPWDMEKKIDMEQTRENFIQNLVRDCSYLSNKKVMPKHSLLYEKFSVLNEINSLKIRDKKIDVSLKQEIYNELFMHNAKVSKEKLVKYLINNGFMESKEELTGIDINIKSALASYDKFCKVFGDDNMKKDSYRKAAEDAIYYCTIYGDSRKLLKDVLKKEVFGSKYGVEADDEQIKRIIGFKFKDWARLSRSFLELEAANVDTGEAKSLIGVMWETNMNLNEVLFSNKYNFKKVLEEKRRKEISTIQEFTFDDLSGMYFPNPVKRMIWQTVLVVKEIEHIMGHAPAKVFVEMTRSEDDKKERKDSRGKQLEELYNKIKDENKEWAKGQIDKIKEYDSNGMLKSKKLYLYYLQMGKDMYTGKPIDIEDLLSNNSKYDIDHIYPESVSDDSNISNNLVLVSKEMNNNKRDTYPIDENIRKKCYPLWKTLLDKELITQEKFYRLVRNTKLTDEEMARFIARQLVETSQATKGVTELLKMLFENQGTKIVYAKARNVSKFRQYYGFPKSRLINDFHHAHDAYLNIVVGNVYYTKFTQDPRNFYAQKRKLKDSDSEEKKKQYYYHLRKMFKWDVQRNGNIAWIAPTKFEPKKDEEGNDIPGTYNEYKPLDGTFMTVKKMLGRNTPILSRMNYEGSGGLANATVISHKKVKDVGYLPLKATDEKIADVKKYGGVTSISSAYFFAVEHEAKKNKKVRTIETVPVYLKNKIETEENGLEKYCIDVLKLVNPRILVPKIKIKSLIKVDGYYLYLTGKSEPSYILSNAVSMCLDNYWVKYISKIEKQKFDGLINEADNLKLYDILLEKHRTSIFGKKPVRVLDTLEKLRDSFRNANIENQVIALKEIVNATSIGNQKINLTCIGGTASVAYQRINKKISMKKEFKLINQSVTGLYQNEIDLLSI